jgi:pantoate--beta-alanine ligase
MKELLVIHTVAEWRAYRKTISGETRVAFVPTMGALHDGHASLVRAARALVGDKGIVAASIFVNPTQFGPQEDFNRYPRTLAQDSGLLQEAGCDVVFVPAVEEMYPGISALSTQHSLMGTSIDAGPMGNILEGAIRPGHFRGVCTVVAKLLHVVEPTVMYLGQKDYQQQAIVRRMVRDLNMAVEIITAPTIRESDGLAMSSRNRYLSPDQRRDAVGLYEALTKAKAAFDAGERRAATIEQLMTTALGERKLDIQYAMAVHAETLASFESLIVQPAVLLIAVKVGTTRLIDNMLL